MQNRFRAFARAATGAALLVSALACSTTIGTNPNAYPFPSDQVFALGPEVRVSVANGYASETRVELGSRVFCDLRHFSETATAIVSRELAKKGAAVATPADKSITLRITHPAWVQGSWTMKGRVTLEAQLGNGEKLAYDGELQTAGNAMRAFNGAILRAVTAFLKDPAVAAYLNGPSAGG
jgi:hypothetical protein